MTDASKEACGDAAHEESGEGFPREDLEGGWVGLALRIVHGGVQKLAQNRQPVVSKRLC